jgi:hypothetical protein
MQVDCTITAIVMGRSASLRLVGCGKTELAQEECAGPRAGGEGAVHELGQAKGTGARGKVGNGRRWRKGEQRENGGKYKRLESGEA